MAKIHPFSSKLFINHNFQKISRFLQNCISTSLLTIANVPYPKFEKLFTPDDGAGHNMDHW